MQLRSLSVLALGVALALPAFDAAADDLVLHLSFEGDSGNVALDHSGFGNHATFFGNPQWIDGVHDGQALAFDGATWGEVPDDPSLDITGALTMSAWAQVEPGGEAIQSAMEKGSAWMEGEYNLAALYNGGSILQARDLPVACADTNVGASIQGGTWAHLTGVWDGAEIKLYVDGILDASMPCAGELLTNDDPLFIGARGGTGRFLAGALDELRIYDYALTDAQVMEDTLSAAPVEARGKMTTAWASLKAVR
ncbi:LamG domain-containing protein [Candidatus Poribacteria bacterium]|jgi:hypothetical protein|nr:LamG domain-containing protein [Candidatus Poribacteria bacterium]MBT5534757.1 LamG domain-containing protein [Candidatus Poribacteria bacterium]MBT5711884.1 LamG domain-containing protein [Candidatus Poribacteria bacterium]MBT7097304.1 LamG domain-containing protein [Candidatus Poribacteria bacterium]MBT7809102.1 LamG domain-containing protein [Candidatus Poribacteria bacterium]